MATVQTTAGGIPVLILKEGTKENKGREAQKNNIAAAKLVAAMVKTCLGPRGMDKMLVSSIGDATITNDGVTILKEMDVEHPAAKMMVEIAKSVDNEVGDGTTSSVVFAGALLEKAEDLINKHVYPSVIVDGYDAASKQALKLLQKISIKVDVEDKELLMKIARTSMYSKLVSEDSPILSQIAVDATKQVAEKVDGDSLSVDLDNIKVEKKAGGSIHDTKLIKGMILDKEVVHTGKPKRIEKAKIALINSALVNSIPLALAENAGMDPIDTMTELRTKQNKGAKWTGIDVRNTKVADMFKQDVLEPLAVKEQIIKSATEAACMLLRIDDVIASSKSKMPAGPPGGGGGGMGGMGGGYGGGVDME